MYINVKLYGRMAIENFNVSCIQYGMFTDSGMTLNAVHQYR